MTEPTEQEIREAFLSQPRYIEDMTREESFRAGALWARQNGADNEVRAAAAALVAKLDECKVHIAGAFTLAWLHGATYDGPNYGAELEALRAALAVPSIPGEER